MRCFVCGERLACGHRVALTGFRHGLTIRLHERCASHLAQNALALLQARPYAVETFRSDAGALDPLTAGELGILHGLVRGETNRQIARHLGLAEKTISNRVSVILSKLQSRSRTEAAVIALRTGVVQVE